MHIPKPRHVFFYVSIATYITHLLWRPVSFNQLEQRIYFYHMAGDGRFDFHFTSRQFLNLRTRTCHVCHCQHFVCYIAKRALQHLYIISRDTPIFITRLLFGYHFYYFACVSPVGFSAIFAFILFGHLTKSISPK